MPEPGRAGRVVAAVAALLLGVVGAGLAAWYVAGLREANLRASLVGDPAPFVLVDLLAVAGLLPAAVGVLSGVIGRPKSTVAPLIIGLAVGVPLGLGAAVLYREYQGWMLTSDMILSFDWLVWSGATMIVGGATGWTVGHRG
jgi:hypothetical protein